MFNAVTTALPDDGDVRANTEALPKPRTMNVPELGLDLKSQSGGIIISDVDPMALAVARGLKVGEVILDVTGKKISTVADFRTAIDTARRSGKNSVLMRVRSGNSMRFVAIPLQAR
jgi:serine protease Do